MTQTNIQLHKYSITKEWLSKWLIIKKWVIKLPRIVMIINDKHEDEAATVYMIMIQCFGKTSKS